MGQEEYRDLSTFLDRFVLRLKMLRGAEGLCVAAVTLLLVFSLGLAIQEIKSVLPYAPLVYSTLVFAAFALVLGWTAYQCLKRISREWAALFIEKRHPHLRNNLINSLQLYPQLTDERRSGGISPSMVLALLRATRKQVGEIRLKNLIDTNRIKTELRLFAMLFVPVLAVVLLNPSSVGTTFSLLVNPLKDVPSSVTMIDVRPKSIRIVRGAPVTIEATASGTLPRSMELLLWTGDEQQREIVPMKEIDRGKFSATLPGVQKSMRYRVVGGVSSSASYAIEAIDPPDIANVKITLYPPHYTGLGTQTLQGGNIEAIRGSAARIEAWSSKEVHKAKLLLDDGKEVPIKIDGRRLQGNLVLFESHRYQILTEDPLGFRNSPIQYEIRVRADGSPTVDLLNPTEDLQVNGDETIPLELSARDDFGIQEVTLSARVGDRQEKLPIHKEGNKKFIAREQFRWDLGKLGLQEGEEVLYHLEVTDNDTVSGPKVGSSRVLRLRLKDLRGEHRQLGQMIRELSTGMLDLLADHLETSDEKKFRQSADAMTERIDEIMRRTEKDRLSDFATWQDLEALKRNLEFTKDDLLKKRDQSSPGQEREKLDDEISTELERMSLLAEDISKRLQAQEFASTAQDVMKSQERLMDSLEKLKSGDKNLDAVLKEISNLAKMLGSLQQSLSQFASRLPDDFMNSDALRGLGFGEMLSALEEIRKKLLQGDVEGAMQLARELFNQLASMIASLQGAQQSAQSSSMGRMQGEMMRSANELQQIVREQQEILVETEGVQKGSLQDRDQKLKGKLEPFQAKAQQQLSRLAELFPDDEKGGERSDGPRDESLDDATINHLIKNMMAHLLKRDFSSFAEIMEMAEKELAKKRSRAQEGKAQQAETGLKSLRRDLQDLFDEPLALFDEEKKKGLRELSNRQAVLKERTEDLHERLNNLFQLFPSLDPKITKDIQESTTFMDKAEQRLGDLDAKAAVPPERDALDRLSQSQQQMQSAMEQLAQRGQLGRMPVTYLFRRGRFLPSGRLVPLPGMPEFPQFESEGGITGLDMERFKLPGKGDYKAPPSFREEILESLKQGIPSQLKEQIESYFRNLSE